jgi:hypothetical protein
MKSDFTVYKTKVNGNYVLMPASYDGMEALKEYPENKRIECRIKYVKSHNLERHDLFHACIHLVAENLSKPEWVIKEKVKIDCGWIKGYIAIDNKVNVFTRSISFAEMSIQDANKFYSVAFVKLAEYIQLTAEEMTAEAKERMIRRY